MDIKEFKEKLFEKAPLYGFEEYDLYYNSGASFKVNIFKGEVDEYKNTSNLGAGFRGLYSGKMGYAYTETLSEDAIDYLLKNAKENAEILEIADERIYKGADDYAAPPETSQDLFSIDVNGKIAFALQMEKEAYELDERVHSVQESVVATATGDTYIANSYGLELYRKEAIATAYIEVAAKSGDDIKVNYEIWQGKDWNGFQPKEISRIAVEKSVKALGGSPVESGNYDILLENKAAISLLEVYLPSFYGENVQKGFSLLAGKTGEAIANPIVSMHDNMFHEKSLTPLTFDSEGVKVRDKVIIENGVLKAFFHNYKSALKDGIEPTGNGFKASFKEAVSTSVANCFIMGQDNSFSSLVEKLSHGLIITELQGLHAGCNSVSGDFSLLAEGFLVEGGLITRPVEQITIAGNFFVSLKNITALGNDLRFEPVGSGGSLGCPSIIVSNVSVSGL